MTATARAMRMGARSIITGHQIIGQLHGLATHVGPNALLRSSSYPAIGYYPPQAGGASGPLTAVPFTGTYSYMRIDGSSEFGTGGICTNWAGAPTSPGASPPYIYNNHPSNLGGIVPAGGMMIDGWEVPAGTYVFQFMDLSWGGSDILGGAPSLMFRGCRARGGAGDVGFWTLSDPGYTGNLWFLFCDSGGLSGADPASNCIKAANGATVTFYRNYLSLTTTSMQPGTLTGNVIDIFENFTEQLVVFDSKHLNGMTLNGTQENCRIVRNNVVIVTPDVNDSVIDQTDCISFFQDTGGFPGTGTNPDGTTGYQVMRNYLGGTGYCIYPGTSGGEYAGTPPSNLNLQDNLVTTSVYPITDPGNAPGGGGGYDGPIYTPPTWGQNGNFQANNLWADGPDRGTSFM